MSSRDRPAFFKTVRESRTFRIGNQNCRLLKINVRRRDHKLGVAYVRLVGNGIGEREIRDQETM